MAGDRHLHIVVFPWVAFGHMLPFLELSKALAGKGHRISYLSTPRNLRRLPNIPPPLASLINLVPLPVPPVLLEDEEGPDETPEATCDLPPHRIPQLKIAYDALEPAVAEFLREASPRPDWVVQDFASHWLPEAAAAARGIPCAFFSVFPVPFLGFLGPPSELKRTSWESPRDLTITPSWVTVPDSAVVFKLHEARDLLTGAYTVNASGFSDAFRLGTTVANCKAVVGRSIDEFSRREWLQLLRDLYSKPVISAGLLPPASVPSRDEVGDDGLRVLEWLDAQRPGSVLYVAFGSEAALTPESLHELALGLELSGHPFLWALRRPIGSPEETRLLLPLPDGFEKRTVGRGLVVTTWVPQVSVLSHASVGAFLTHSGWSSIIEALQFGLPLVSLPVFVDQTLNSRVVVEEKIGIEIERDEDDGSFAPEAVAKAVRSVMSEEEGEEQQGVRATARAWSLVFADKDLNQKYVDGLVQYLLEHKQRFDPVA